MPGERLDLIAANVLAWMVAVTGSYVMNSYVTFAAESGRKLRWKAFFAFAAAGILGVIANTATLVVAADFMPVVAAKDPRHRRRLPDQFLDVAFRRVPADRSRSPDARPTLEPGFQLLE